MIWMTFARSLGMRLRSWISTPLPTPSYSGAARMLSDASLIEITRPDAAGLSLGGSAALLGFRCSRRAALPFAFCDVHLRYFRRHSRLPPGGSPAPESCHPRDTRENWPPAPPPRRLYLSSRSPPLRRASLSAGSVTSTHSAVGDFA